MNTERAKTGASTASTSRNRCDLSLTAGPTTEELAAGATGEYACFWAPDGHHILPYTDVAKIWDAVVTERPILRCSGAWQYQGACPSGHAASKGGTRMR